MRPGVHKFALAAHLAFSIGWLGAAAAYIALGLAAEASGTAETVRGAWIGMELVGWYVIVPLAVATLVTGVVMACGTRWGLFRHYWVVFSLALTAFAALVLVLHMPTVSEAADVARAADATHVLTLGGDLGHPVIGLVLLLVITGLNVYKPKGMTAYGRRRQRQGRRSAA